MPTLANPGAPEVTMKNHVSHPLAPGVYYTDTVEPTDTCRDWWHLLKKNRLSMNDSTVRWPRFLKFCVNVYNWADRTFNSYDTTYVVGTGHRWKARLVNDNWTDSYSLRFKGKIHMIMQSDMYCHAGGYLQYMAVSVGYSIDLSNIIGNKPTNHYKFQTGFSCARFNASITYSENRGGTYLRKFGKYDPGTPIFKEYFEGIDLHTFTADVYYFFNNRKYAEGASYAMSKYQKKSAGSFILGFSYANQDLTLDFSRTPAHLLPYLVINPRKYRFHYHNFCILAGYGFNWAIKPKKFVYNITALPAIGFNHCYEDSEEGSVKLFSWGFKAKTSFVYNIGDFFASVQGSMDALWYNSGKTSLISSIEDISVTIGVRF